MKFQSSFRLTGADGVRAIACLSVIAHHLTQRLAMEKQADWVKEIQSVLLLGNTGVSVFFVLSGFLLSFPFWQNYLGQGDFPSIKSYMLRRAARIIPGYYTSLLVSAILVLALHIPTEYFWIRQLSGFTFTAGFHYVTFFPSDLNGPLWSISFEVVCYALMPLMMLGLFGLSRNNCSYKKAFVYWLGALLLIFCINQLIHLLLTPNHVKRGWEYGIIGGAKSWMPNYNPIGFYAHFSIGIIAAGIAAKMNREFEKIEKFKKMGGFDFICLFNLTASLTLLWWMRHKPEFGMSFQNQPYYFPLYAILISGILSAAPFANWAGKLLDNPFFRFTAKVSFGLYIWHSLVIWAIATYWKPNYQYMRMGNLGEWTFVSVTVLVSAYMIATLSFYLIEKPMLDWSHGKKRSKKAIASHL